MHYLRCLGRQVNQSTAGLGRGRGNAEPAGWLAAGEPVNARSNIIIGDLRAELYR